MRVQTNPDCQNVSVQIKPDCQEVAVQTKPDHQEEAVQTKIFPTGLWRCVYHTQLLYGSIQLNHFSGNAVAGKKNTPWSYCGHLYYSMKQMSD